MEGWTHTDTQRTPARQLPYHPTTLPPYHLCELDDERLGLVLLQCHELALAFDRDLFEGVTGHVLNTSPREVWVWVWVWVWVRGMVTIHPGFCAF